MPFEVYLQPQGFLGTGASLLADLTLLAYILLIVPAMIVGFVFARRKMFRPYHKWTMIIITIVNTILIGVLMVTAYRFDVGDNMGVQPGNARYLLPTLHAIIGLPAQVLAFYNVYRMLREDAQVAAAKKRGEKDFKKYFFTRAKSFMRLTLALWLATATLGVVSYLIRYDVLSSNAASPAAPPIATPEVESTPELTPEVDSLPAATPEIDSLPAATPEIDATPEVTADTPISTPEVEANLTRTPRPTRTTETAPRSTPEITTNAPVSTPEVEPSPIRTARAPVQTAGRIICVSS